MVTINGKGHASFFIALRLRILHVYANKQVFGVLNQRNSLNHLNKPKAVKLFYVMLCSSKLNYAE